ncbi:hypothetical protein [Haloarcula vallismortis]
MSPLTAERCCFETREYQGLDRRSASKAGYTYHARAGRCGAVPAVVTDSIGDGVVFESERTGARIDGECCRRSSCRLVRCLTVSNHHLGQTERSM